MKTLLIVWAMFGPPDAELGDYTWVSFQYEYPSLELCLAATEQVEKDLMEKEDYRASSVQCRGIQRTGS